MDLDTGIIVDDLSISISIDEFEETKDSTTNIIPSDNDICIKALDYMLF